jgi:hypothetical protein
MSIGGVFLTESTKISWKKYHGRIGDVSEAYRRRIGTYQNVSELSGYSDIPTGVSDAYRTWITPAPVSNTYPIWNTWVMSWIWVTQLSSKKENTKMSSLSILQLRLKNIRTRERTSWMKCELEEKNGDMEKNTWLIKTWKYK